MEELSFVRAEFAQIRNEKDAILASTSSLASTNKPMVLEPTSSRAGSEEITATVSSTLLASVNNMSLSTMSIPECKPSDGEAEIDRKGYEYWKNIAVASLNLIQAADEFTKMDVFKIKAGAKLLELLQGIKSSAEMPDAKQFPFSNALARLDGYFGSRAYMLSQRSKLINMMQQTSETNIQFVRRVATSAKLCGYEKEDDEMEAMARTLIKNSTDQRVRILAHRNWIKQGSLSDLIGDVRDYETERTNEQEFQRIRQPQGSASIAAISNMEGRGQLFRNNTGRFNNRGRGYFSRGPSFRREMPRKACWRCASIYHVPAQCPNIEKVCHTCNRRGHLARCCLEQNQLDKSTKRLAGPDDEAPPRKIAAIKNEEEKNEIAPIDVSEVD